LLSFSFVWLLSNAISKCLDDTYCTKACTATHVWHLVHLVIKEMGQWAGLTLRDLDYTWQWQSGPCQTGRSLVLPFSVTPLPLLSLLLLVF
jgi:hypothetical protein